MRLAQARVLSALLLSCFAAAGAQGPATPSAPPAAEAGMAAYKNGDLHLTYHYPASYTDAAAVMGPAFAASLGNDPTSALAARCITLPFSRMAAGPRPASGPAPLGIVALVHADAACLGKKFNAKSLAEFTEGEVGGLSAAGAKTSLGHPVPYQLGAHAADLLQGTFTLPAGQPMHTLVSCVLDQPDIVCWLFFADSADRLHTMAAFPVTFDPAPATPLVPASLLRP